jgi:3'-phosphoadenosine 5'-phosphosulfate sulfotransferase (PAPS reductase)/FAD synthetase
MDCHDPGGIEMFPTKIKELLDAGALFAVSHSGGKDSQATLIYLRQLGVPDRQILLVHADLGEVEWPGNVAHIERTAPGLPLVIAKARRGLLQMIEERGKFPSAKIRQCTSDLKRGPITREIRRYLKAHPEYRGQVVSCIGLRAAESRGRAQLDPVKFHIGNSVAGRVWYDWLPIHQLSTAEVFQLIKDAGQEPHPIYAAGMTRASCCFCIMSSKCDLRTAARLNPTLYRRYVFLEKTIGHTMNNEGIGLEQITGILAN